MYPAKTVRRINTVKQLMVDGYTIEEIQGQFLLYTDLVEGVAEHLAELWTRLDADTQRLEPQARRELDKELADARRDGDRLVERLGELARRSPRRAPTASVSPAPRGAPRTCSRRGTRADTTMSDDNERR